MFNNFFSGKCTAYEKMWKDTVVPGKPQMTAWRMHCAC